MKQLTLRATAIFKLTHRSDEKLTNRYHFSSKSSHQELYRAMTSLSQDRLPKILKTSSPYNYRPDIEGLRAVAILLVIFYHAGFTSISGGFIGVDIFFVISGFLITSIIQKNIISNQFNLSDFYARRLRRIAPALIVMILTCSITAYFVLLPEDLKYFSKSVVTALLSMSNFLFWNEASGYFSQSTEQLPLIHTWSLAVEEQFYLILPVVMVALQKLRKPWKIASFSGVLIASLAYSIWAVDADPISAYFLLPSRAFELLVGSGLALTWAKLPELTAFMSNLVRLTSLSVIGYSALTIDKSTHFPGLAAILPCIATAAIIYAGKTKHLYRVDSSFLLSNNLSTSIGKVSYSLYLWHWPIIALLNYRGVELTTTVSFTIIALSVTLSVATYHFVEQPFRKSSWRIQPAAAYLWATPLATAFILCLLVLKNDGLQFRFNSEIAAEFSTSNSPWITYKDCFNSYTLDNLNACSIGKPGEPITGMFIGDSMAGHYIPFLDELAKNAGIRIFATASSGLPPFHVKNHVQFKEQRNERALNYNKERINQSLNYSNVYIAASWAQGYPYLSENERELLDSIEFYIKNGIHVTLISRPNTITNDMFNHVKTERLSGKNISAIRAPAYDSNFYLRKIVEKFPDISVIDPNKILCNRDNCAISIGNKTIYEDYAHINNYGSRELALKYISKIGNPLAISKGSPKSP